MFGVEKAFIGFCGGAGVLGELATWFIAPSGRGPNIRNGEMLMLCSDGIYHANSVATWNEVRESYFSIGSGMQYALAAMEAGKTPSQAIKIATKYDIYTGLGVKTYKL